MVLVLVALDLGGTHDRGALVVVCCCQVCGNCCLCRVVVLHEHEGVFRLPGIGRVGHHVSASRVCDSFVDRIQCVLLVSLSNTQQLVFMTLLQCLQIR